MEAETPEIFRQMTVKECLDLKHEMQELYPTAKVIATAPAYIWFELVVGADKICTTIRSRAEWETFWAQLQEVRALNGAG